MAQVSNHSLLQQRLWDAHLRKLTGIVSVILPNGQTLDFPFISGRPLIRYKVHEGFIELPDWVYICFETEPSDLIIYTFPTHKIAPSGGGPFIDIESLLFWGTFGRGLYLKKYLKWRPNYQVIIKKIPSFKGKIPPFIKELFISSKISLRTLQYKLELEWELLLSALYPLQLMRYIEVREINYQVNAKKSILLAIKNALFRKKEQMRGRAYEKATL